MPRNRRRGRALLAAAAIALALPLAQTVGGSAHAESGATASVVVLDAAEAWYADAPTTAPCTLPLGCPKALPTSPFPKDTLHVGVIGTRELERSYVQPDLSQLPLGAVATTGTMTLPLTDPTAGTLGANMAHLKACLATKPFPDGTAGADVRTAPAYDCAVSAVPSYDAAQAAFTLSLTPFLNAWAAGRLPYGIALVPDSTKAMPTDAWQVAFSGRQRSGFLRISSVISYQLPAPNSPVLPQPVPPLAAPPPVSSGGTTPLPGVGVAPPPAEQPPPQVVGPQQSRPASFHVTRFQYPMAFLFPLLLLAGGWFLVRLFTRDATPVRRS